MMPTRVCSAARPRVWWPSALGAGKSHRGRPIRPMACSFPERGHLSPTDTPMTKCRPLGPDQRAAQTQIPVQLSGFSCGSRAPAQQCSSQAARTVALSDSSAAMVEIWLRIWRSAVESATEANYGGAAFGGNFRVFGQMSGTIKAERGPSQRGKGGGGTERTRDRPL